MFLYLLPFAVNETIAADKVVSLLMASSETITGQRYGQRTLKAGVKRAALFLALFTCMLRCSECQKPRNIVLILADDQDVALGGMVSNSCFHTDLNPSLAIV